jgi:uncharacterized protein YraI
MQLLINLTPRPMSIISRDTGSLTNAQICSAAATAILACYTTSSWVMSASLGWAGSKGTSNVGNGKFSAAYWESMRSTALERISTRARKGDFAIGRWRELLTDILLSLCIKHGGGTQPWTVISRLVTLGFLTRCVPLNQTPQTVTASVNLLEHVKEPKERIREREHFETYSTEQRKKQSTQ